jgi:uncharacterized membrane protein
MSLLFEQPVWLWLAVLALPTLVVGWWGFRAMSGVRRWASIVIRCGLLAIIIAIIAGLSIRKTTNIVAVVAVIDVSGSARSQFVPPALAGEDEQSIAQAAALEGDALTRYVRRYLSLAMPKLGEEDLFGLVLFDGSAAVVATPSRSRSWERPLDIRLREGTNIAEALRLARGIMPPDAAGRIVLLSDGNQTAGDALAASREISRPLSQGDGGSESAVRTLPVMVVPFRFRLDNEVVVESVDAPPAAAAQSTINVRVVLAATQPSTGNLTLLRENVAIDLNGAQTGTARRIALQPGRNVQVLEVPLPAGRVHRFRAVYEPDVVEVGTNAAGAAAGATRLAGDTNVQNNEGEGFTITPGRGRVLLVDGLAAMGRASSPLAGTLRSAGVDVSVENPAGLDTNPLALEAFDLLILENVPSDMVSVQQQQELILAVRDMGLGLVLVGGPESFGAGGWRGSPLAAVMPVELELPDTLVAPQTATVLVLDNSGSMNMFVLGSTKSQMQIATDAAAMAVRTMDRSDLVSVIAFNSNAEVSLPLSRVGDAKAAVDAINAISGGGGTNMAAGLEDAIEQLRGVETKVKHVIVLSDGKSQRSDELPGLTDRLKAMGAKVSTIAVGNDADINLLARLSERSGGAHYYVSNPRQLPRIFLKAVRVLRAPLIREQPFTPTLLGSGSAFVAGLSQPLPQLGGIALTRRRAEETISVSMLSDKGEPVLAGWNVGLGQVVAFTSDAGTWASQWLAWPGYQRMWTQIVRSASRPPVESGVLASATLRGDELVVRATAADKSGTPLTGLSMPATIYSPSGRAIEVNLQPVGVGEYQAVLRAEETGSYVGVVRPRFAEGAIEGSAEGVATGAATASATGSAQPRRLPAAVVGAAVPRGSEFRALASNDRLLEQIAAATGGRVLDPAAPQLAEFFSREGLTPAEAISPLTKQLLPWAIVLLLLDIASRRVAWDRWVSKRMGAGSLLATERAAATQERLATAAAGAGMGELRRASASVEQRVESVQRSASGLVLSDTDARSLAEAARDKRRATRLAQAAASVPAGPSPKPAAGNEPGTPGAPAPSAAGEGRAEQGEPSSLLAAKQRANRKYQ